MCIAVPAKIEEINGDIAVVNYGGVSLNTNITLIDDPKVGEYILLHAGCAIEKIDEEEALETLDLFNELAKYADIGE